MGHATSGKPLISLAETHDSAGVRTGQAGGAVNRVIVATDDERIVKAIEAFGGEARMTRSEHRTGTEASRK